MSVFIVNTKKETSDKGVSFFYAHAGCTKKQQPLWMSSCRLCLCPPPILPVRRGERREII